MVLTEYLFIPKVKGKAKLVRTERISDDMCLGVYKLNSFAAYEQEYIYVYGELPCTK